MKKTRWLSVILALVLVFSLGTSAFAAAPAADSGNRQFSNLPGVKLAQADGQYQAGDQVRVVVLTESQPIAENHTLIQKLTNTQAKLLREHNAVKAKMEQKDVSFTVNFEYTDLLNGMSVTMDYADLATVAALPGVKEAYVARVYQQPVLEPKADSAAEMIDANLLNDLTGADGSGKVIAVLDTGITAYHEAFAVYDGMLQTPAYTEAQMRSKIVDLGHGDYYSQKIPFLYDYADGDNDAIDDGSSHGSHVAGIAAGYVATEEGEVTFHGSAPDAQILAMKIFGSTEKTTSSDIYFAALEDAYKLGADVINMSIGAPNGFTADAELETETFGNIYKTLESAGIICCISAGNENTMAEYTDNWLSDYGYNFIVADYADYGVLGSPASYEGNVAVAAVENMVYPAYRISVGENGFAYRDSNGTAFLDAFAGQDLEYVMIPNLGAAEDFEGLDVEGKVAVISRGEITFAEKVANAVAAGAIAAVIYDNAEGALVSMAIDDHVIPSVFVEKAAGAALEAAETKTFHVDSEPTIVENPDAWSIASFSSWGPTNDLQIKPTITGVGGNVNSALAGTADGYEVSSGTSMSSPNAAGGYAALLDAICAENPKLSKAEAADIARNRTLSHAYVLPSAAEELEDGSYLLTPYSPRQQGAGLLDLSAAYLATLDITDPLCELGDDPDRTGVYTITSELKNTTDEEQTFAVAADVLTDGGTAMNFGDDEAPDYHFYNTLSSVLLEEGVDYTLDAPETVTLAPGETKTVTVTITLTEETKADYLDAVFTNGTFIEGYVYFTNEFEEAHSTFLAFYGDWTSGPILETHDWRDLVDVETDPAHSDDPMDYVDWEIDTTPTMAYLVDSEYNPMVYAGDSPMGKLEPGQFSDARIAVSNNPDDAYFTTLLVVPTIIRNARHIVMIARDAETGAIYAVDDTPYCPKTIFDPDEGAFTTNAWFMFNGMDLYSSEEPTPIPDNTKVNLEFYANLPVGEDVLGSLTPEEIVESGEYLAYVVPCVVDGAAPELEYSEENGTLSVTVSDNQFLSAVYLTDAEGYPYAIDEEGHPYVYIASEHEDDETEPVFLQENFADDEAGESHTVTFDISELYSFCVCAMDFATNETYEYIYREHDHALSEVEAVEPTCDEAGFAAHYVCDLCGLEFVDAEGKEEITSDNYSDLVIPALGHDLQKVEAVEPTCTEDGNIAYWQCSRCGLLYVSGDGMEEVEEADVILPAAGHELVAVEEVPATCETDGAKAHFKCETCAKLFSDAEGTAEIEAPEVIPALGHDWDEGVVTKEPTLISEGEKLFTCKNDPSHTRTEVIAKLHDCDGGDNCPSKDYTDVDRSATSWSHAAIDWAVLNEITNGTTKTTFSPNKTCTRAEAVTFLWRAAGCPDVEDVDNPFTDVTLDSWYAKAVLWAVDEGITNGTSDTTFSPDDTCSRGQIVTFLWRMQGEPEAKEASSFSDVSAKDYYAPAVDWAVEEGITNGVSANLFAPKDDCTRAHIVTFLFRCLAD